MQSRQSAGSYDGDLLPPSIAIAPASAPSMIRQLEVPFVIGSTFGLLAGACAFVIAYAEYQRHFQDERTSVRMALAIALPAFLFFFLAAFLPWRIWGGWK